MLRAQGLQLRRAGLTVLADIDLQLGAGEVLGVLGPNGAGKSSLLAALCGELPLAGGSVSLVDRPLRRWRGTERARRLAVLPQRSSLDFAFRVEEVVAMGRLPHASGSDEDARIVAHALQAADIGHLAGRSYLALSGGERQRVHIARIFAQLWPAASGKVLLLDEPVSMLDPLHQHLTLQAVREMARQGVAVLIILHDLNLAARYCDRLLLLRAGTTQALGTPCDVLQAGILKDVFGLEVLVRTHPELGHPLIIDR